MEPRFFFGNELNNNSLESCFVKIKKTIKEKNFQFHFVLSKVRWIDIDAALFLLCILGYLKGKGFQLLLTLPEENGRWDFTVFEENSAEEKTRKARDFLKRWCFDVALLEVFGSVSDLLPPHQEDYFECPLLFYQEGVTQDDNGKSIRALSTKMIEITHMTRGPDGAKFVDEAMIESFVEEFALEKRFQQAICKTIGNKDEIYFAKEFASTIIKEALLNTFEHPDATLSMIAMARDVHKNLLVVARACPNSGKIFC